MKISHLNKFLGTLEEKIFLSDKFHSSTNNKKLDNTSPTIIPKEWTQLHFKSYPRLERVSLINNLPNGHIWRIMRKRRSYRNYRNKSLSKKELSSLLYGSSGLIKFGKSFDKSRRPYPSAGGRFPLEVYPLIFNCDKFKKGLYHYNIKENCLELLLQKDLREWLVDTTGGEKWIKKAAVVFIITGILDRTRIKYGDRGYRYTLIEAGHLAQNLLILATDLGLNSCPIGGFIDFKLNELLDIQIQKEYALYLIAIGKNE